MRGEAAVARFWYINCAVCRQGRLFVYKRSDSGSLLLECEECSRAWHEPEQATAGEGGFLGIDIAGEDATRAEIEAAGWSRYSFHEATD